MRGGYFPIQPYRGAYNYYNYGPGSWQGWGNAQPQMPPQYYGGTQAPTPQYTPPSGGYGPDLGGPSGQPSLPGNTRLQRDTRYDSPYRTQAPPQGQYGPAGSGGPPGDPRNMIPVIVAAAKANGIDPNIAVRVAQSEGLGANGYNHDPHNPAADYGRSGGAMQLFLSGKPNGALGDIFWQETGLDPRDPRNEAATIWWSMHRVRQDGWGNGKTGWHGAAGQGIYGFTGVGPLPTTTASAGGQMFPPGTVRAANGAWQVPGGSGAGAPRYRAIGDSIAQGYQQYGGLGGTRSNNPVDPTNVTVDAAGGRSPSTILKYLQSLPDGALAGEPGIVFSTGVSNNPNEAGLVPQELAELKRLGAKNVQVVGVGTQAGYEGKNYYNLNPYNAQIQQAAQQAGMKFTGGLPAYVHPDKSFYQTSVAGMPQLGPPGSAPQPQPPEQPPPTLVTGGSLPGIAPGQVTSSPVPPEQTPQLVTGGAMPGVQGRTVSGGPTQLAAAQPQQQTRMDLPDSHTPPPPPPDAPWKYPWPSVLVPGKEQPGVILQPGEMMPQPLSGDTASAWYPFSAPQAAPQTAGTSPSGQPDRAHPEADPQLVPPPKTPQTAQDQPDPNSMNPGG